MQKELVLQFPKRKISLALFNQQSCTQNHSEASYHNASLLLSPQVSLTVAAFQGAPRRLSVTMPSFSQDRSGLGCPESWSEHHSKREPRIPSSGVPPCWSRGSFALARPSHQSGSSRGWWLGISLGPPEMLQKPVLEKPSITLGELENSGLLGWWAQRS